MDRCSEALEHATAAVSRDGYAPGKDAAPTYSSSHFSIAAKPNSPVARAALCVNLANVRLQQGELEMAESCLNQALALHPSSSEAIRALVYLRLRQGNTRSALLLLQQRRLCFLHDV